TLIVTLSMNEVRSPSVFRPLNVMRCDPALTESGVVEKAVYVADVPGVNVPTRVVSMKTLKSLTPSWLLRNADRNEMVAGPPMGKLTFWEIVPVFCRIPTWTPSGALALLNALPLFAMPLLLMKDQLPPEGLYWNAPALSAGTSKLLFGTE